MWNWFVNLINGASGSLGQATTSINDQVAYMNTQAYLQNSLVFSFIGNIHYIAGDLIFYECVTIIGIGIVMTITKTVIAIIRMIKEVKQTVLF